MSVLLQLLWLVASLSLVGQPSSARADVVNPTPAQVVPDAASVSEKSDLPAEVLKKAVDVALPSEQSIPAPKASLDTTSSFRKSGRNC